VKYFENEAKNVLDENYMIVLYNMISLVILHIKIY